MDQREHPYYPDYIREDHKQMRLLIDEDVAENGVLSYPAHYEVCPVCNGKGTHVNPSIDSHGLSAEDFAEDPDFARDYVKGRYDVPCVACHGRNVILVPNEKDGKKFVEEAFRSESSTRAEYEAERRMGA
jgi:hypothetical protein